MSYPPPFRYLVPALLLVFGLTATWLDYRLNLANDLERNFADVTAQAEVTGERLAKLSEQSLARGEASALGTSLAAWKNEPWLRLAAVVDGKDIIIADSDARWSGQPAKDTPAAPALRLIRKNAAGAVQKTTQREGDIIVIGAYPAALGARGQGWVLLVFDRADAVVQAHDDARRQLGWGASVITLLCFCLWAALHFGVAARLDRLARSVREFGDGRTKTMETLPGGDEVHELSVAFADMGRRLAEREQERANLEREVIDSAERERRRIGHELHDGIGQQLTAALMANNGLTDELQSTSTELAGKAENLSVQLRDTIAEVRALSHNLAPVPLWEGGLEHALQALAETTTRSSGVRCVFECPDPISVNDQELAGNLYRIAQEAVNNALKHAQPGEIRIGLDLRGHTLVLEIDDDGEGLPEMLADGGGIGFRVMRHRTEAMGGTFEFGSPPAGGTRIAAHIPLPT